jgi:hypothetical protein
MKGSGTINTWAIFPDIRASPILPYFAITSHNKKKENKNKKRKKTNKKMG